MLTARPKKMMRQKLNLKKSGKYLDNQQEKCLQKIKTKIDWIIKHENIFSHEYRNPTKRRDTNELLFKRKKRPKTNFECVA